MLIILFILSIGLILIACLLFYNAIEWLGKIFELSEATIGSIISIIGTSLPQIIIPLLAFTFLSGVETIQIGIGAIIGTPFVLSTLGFALIGLTIISLAKKSARGIEIDADYLIISRDLKFFLITYSFAIFAGLLEDKVPQMFIGFILLIIYGYYIYRSVVYEERVSEEPQTPLYFSPRGEGPTLEITIFQMISALIGLIGGVLLFVHTLREISISLGGAQSHLLGLILGIIFAPLVIEIPSKITSIIWLRESKDTLVISDIINSMIFQACILVTLGILFSPWKLQGIALLVGSIPLGTTLLVHTTMTLEEQINPFVLLASGGFYLVFIVALFFI